MKAILEFDLDNPYEKENHELMLKANDMHSAIIDFQEWLRKQGKHNQLTEEQAVYLEKVIKQWYEIKKSWLGGEE